ncbi:MAG: ABC transporter permease, partial [Thermoanaerobaculia bacterium]|nr:ABC transporter permease [Thermoanaerobaculia bacterium]
MKWCRVLRALGRVELRQLRFHPRRTLLIALLVAIPVAAVVGGATLARITESTPQEQQIQAMGRAALRVDGISSFADIQRVQQHLPQAVVSTRLFVGAEDVGVSGRRLTSTLIALPSGALSEGGMAEGMVHRVAGEWPENAAEVALSPTVLDGLGVGLGGKVTLEFGVERTVTGIVVNPENVEAPLVVRTPAASEHRGRTSLLVGGSSGLDEEVFAALAEEIESSPGEPLRVRRRAAEGRRSDASLLVFALGCLGFFEAALVIAAAFGIGVRRRQREIGLLGASGATSRGIQVALLLSATAIAGLGGVLGSVAGVGVAAAIHPLLDGWNHRLNGPFEVSLGHLVLGVLLGVLTALLAAALPARSASRQPIRVALGAARPPLDDPRRWLKTGLLLVVAGGLMTLMAAQEGLVTATLGVIVGPVLGLLGFGLCSRWLLDRLARLAGPLPLAWRLAVRDAGRFRARNGPVVTAILAGMAMSVTVAVLVASLDSAIAWIPAPYRSDQVLVEGMEAESAARQIGGELGGLAVAPWAIAYLQGEPLRAVFAEDPRSVGVGNTVAVGSEDLLRAMGAES